MVLHNQKTLLQETAELEVVFEDENLQIFKDPGRQGVIILDCSTRTPLSVAPGMGQSGLWLMADESIRTRAQERGKLVLMIDRHGSG